MTREKGKNYGFFFFLITSTQQARVTLKDFVGTVFHIFTDIRDTY